MAGTFLVKGKEKMSSVYNTKLTIAVNEASYEKRYNPPVNYPQNCSESCPYGYDRTFCFPCYKRMMEYVKQKKEMRNGI